VTHEEAYGKCDGSTPKPADNDVPPPKDDETPKPAKSDGPHSSKNGAPKPTTASSGIYRLHRSDSSTASFIRGGGRPSANIGPFFTKDNTPCSTFIQSTWTKGFDGPSTFSQGSKTWIATAATVLTITDSPVTWTSPISAAGTWAPVEHNAATGAGSLSEQTQRVSADEYGVATQAGSVPEQTQQVWAADATQAYVQPTSSYLAAPAEFTGAASKHRLTGAAVFVAAGAALLV
jgi:hypothetical protein